VRYAPPVSLLVRALGPADLDQTLNHLERLLAENGRGETHLFDPRPLWAPSAKRTFRARQAEAWAKSTDVPGWERTWGAVAEDGRVVGHVNIRVRSEPAAVHRASTSMGVEGAFRPSELGGQLLSAALAWAESQEQLAWLDLFHFEHNVPDETLYRQLGFVQISRVYDMFRVNGISVTDVFMTKKLRSS
jgi:GNAT superfamily N-acetyltransferase